MDNVGRWMTGVQSRALSVVSMFESAGKRARFVIMNIISLFVVLGFLGVVLVII